MRHIVGVPNTHREGDARNPSHGDISPSLLKCVIIVRTRIAIAYRIILLFFPFDNLRNISWVVTVSGPVTDAM